MTMLSSGRLRFASRLAGVHLLLSTLVALLLATLVFLVWYPAPYRNLMGSFKLFFIVVSVDIICGPLLTLILASPLKKHREMILDLSLIAAIQLSAFAYGLYSVYEARPVALVYEKDRLRVLANVDIYRPELPEAPDGYQKIPLFNIWQLGTRQISKEDDAVELLEFALQGYDIGQRPSWWISYEAAKGQIRQYAKPIELLLKKASDMDKNQLYKIANKSRINLEELWYLPLTSPSSYDWTAILDKDMNFLDAIPLESFSNE